MQRPGGIGLAVATVAIALAVQALTSMAMVVPTVLAPVAAADLGADPARIGLLVAAMYLCAMVAGLFCDGLIARHGPVRVFQFVVLLVAGGLAAGAGGHLALAFVLAIMAGIGHGLVNPASSTVLLAASPPQLRSLMFSIKQTGVPLGAALAGLAVPLLLQVLPWRQSVLVLGVASLAVLAAAAPFRRIYDTELDPGRRIRLSAIGRPIAEVVARRELFTLALTSAAYSAVQMSVSTYLILFLVVKLGYTLVAAGLVFSLAQAAGVLGRPLWGILADRLQASRRLLVVLGITMALCGAAAAAFAPGVPRTWIVGVCVLYGASAIGWNGVYLAEVARLSPPGMVGLLTGGSLLFTFSGALLGPPLFGAILGATGNYAAGFWVFAVLPLLAALRLLALGAAGEPDR